MLISSFILTTFTNLQAQFSCTSSYYCGLDLRDPIYTNTEIDTVTYNYGKSPQNANFKDWELAGDCDDITTDACRNDNGELFFVVHYPNDTAYPHYSTCPLPVIFMFHPGGLSDCSSLENIAGIQFMCNEFAKRGFVVFNVEYRRGRLLLPDTSENASEIINSTKTISQVVAAYRASQDARGAIRSALKMQADGVFGTAFKFDETKVFGAGASAGAIAMLSVTYLQKQDMVDDVSPGFKAKLGNVDVDYYYAPPTYALPEIRGVLSMWGNFPMPGSIKTNAAAVTFFNRNNYMAPLIAFQGRTDEVVKFDYRYERYPPNKDYDDGRGNHDTTSFCIDNGGQIAITPTGDDDDLLMIGSLTLRDLLLNEGKEAEVYLDCEMGHGLNNNPINCCASPPNRRGASCTITCYLSEFGTNLTNQNDVQRYMVQRAAVFFQSIITNTAINGPSLFVNCENYRHSCDTRSDQHNGCSNSDICP